MTNKRNAGARAARANMAVRHSNANESLRFRQARNVKVRKVLESWIDSMGNTFSTGRILDSATIVSLKKKVPSLTDFFFGAKIESSQSVARMVVTLELASEKASEAGRSRLVASPLEGEGVLAVDNDPGAAFVWPAALLPSPVCRTRHSGVSPFFGTSYAPPPLFAPRDNGHRQSFAELEKLEELISANTYVVPDHTRDRFERPEWGNGVELVDGRHPDAGKWGRLCFRTACQQPNAFFYNSGTYKHYCQKCADDIDRENMGGFKLHSLAHSDGHTGE